MFSSERLLLNFLLPSPVAESEKKNGYSEARSQGTVHCAAVLCSVRDGVCVVDSCELLYYSPTSACVVKRTCAVSTKRTFNY